VAVARVGEGWAGGGSQGGCQRETLGRDVGGDGGGGYVEGGGEGAEGLNGDVIEILVGLCMVQQHSDRLCH
jgi:hypothetical protein